MSGHRRACVGHRVERRDGWRVGARGGQRGLATVEFAVGSLVVILLMLVAAEVGRAYYSYHTLTKSVRAGSRYLSSVALNSASVMDLNDEKSARVRNLVVEGDPGGRGVPLLDGLTGDDVHIVSAGSSESAARYVRVSATFDYRPMIGLGLDEDRNIGVRMRATSTMRALR